MRPGGESSGGDVRGQKMAEQWLGIAEKLLDMRDFVSTKRFVEIALDCDPLVPGADEIVAVADVLLATQCHLNNQFNWYAILQLDSSTPAGRDPAAVLRQYRRLSILLHPDHNHKPGASDASKLVADAWSVLSNPTKKALFDGELDIAIAHGEAPPSSPATPTAAAPPPPRPDPTFWAACTSCSHLHQYDRAYEGLNLRCPNCRQAFRATALAAPPPIVPGTNMYYCSWGFFPLGFPGGRSFGGTPDLNSGWRPFYPMFPWSGNQPSQPPPDNRQHPTNGSGEPQKDDGRRENAVEPQLTTASAGRNKKKTARKRVGGGLKRTWAAASEGGRAKAATIDVEEEVEFRGININEAAKGSDGGAGVGGDEGDLMSFHIDMDAADELLDNLQNLPFLKD